MASASPCLAWGAACRRGAGRPPDAPVRAGASHILTHPDVRGSGNAGTSGPSASAGRSPRTVPARRRMQSGTCPPLPWTALGHRQRGKRPRFCRQNLLKVLHSGRERCWVVQEGTVQRLPAAVGSVASEGQGARPRAPRGAVWAREGGGVPGTGPPSPRKELTVRENRAARPPDGPAMARRAAPGRSPPRTGWGRCGCPRAAGIPPAARSRLVNTQVLSPCPGAGLTTAAARGASSGTVGAGVWPPRRPGRPGPAAGPSDPRGGASRHQRPRGTGPRPLPVAPCVSRAGNTCIS